MRPRTLREIQSRACAIDAKNEAELSFAAGRLPQLSAEQRRNFVQWVGFWSHVRQWQVDRWRRWSELHLGAEEVP